MNTNQDKIAGLNQSRSKKTRESLDVSKGLTSF